ncbi:GNAT family N-acetyltransferase [Thalassospira sp.]|uniref:GNAT family N-acetyltransferase n=1 Tax=Thalassospira sp. TaxID=1912094 RepID=UPI001B1F75DB|nr:GNAT family N-acetyltransferase [Thalassospira sp.]MBO6805977.1 GNAT family N-acetyltransferase [Thalassospira sp.]
MSLAEKFDGEYCLDNYINACLRVLTCADISEAYQFGINDPDVRKYLGHEGALTVLDLHKFVSGHENSDDQVLFGFYLDNIHRGNVRIHNFDRKSAWLGIALFDKTIWGQGWATKVLFSITQIIWRIPSLEEIFAGVDIENVGSFRAFKKAGFSVYDLSGEGAIFVCNRPITHSDLL